MKHKWHKEIKAWADGAEIEEFACGVWEERDQPRWHLNYQYRIKPQPKEPQYMYVYKDCPIFTSLHFMDKYKENYLGKIKLEVDDA